MKSEGWIGRPGRVTLDGAEPSICELHAWPECDAICQLARDLFQVPVARIVESPATATGRARAASGKAPTAVPAERIRAAFQASAGISTRCGTFTLALVVEDVRPRRFTVAQRKQLEGLAKAAASTIDLRLQTDRQHAEIASLRKKESSISARLAQGQVIADHVTDLVVRRPIGPGHSFTSAMCKELLGLEPDELAGLAYSEIVHPDDLDAVVALLARLKKGELERAEKTYRIRHKLGHWLWVETRFRLLRDVAGHPSDLIAVIRDVSARVAAEEALRASELRYRTLADALPQMVWVVSGQSDLVATYMNEQFRTFYGPIGSLREERVSRNHPEDAPQMAKAWQAALAGKQAYTVEGRLRRHDGVYKWHRMAMIPVLRGGEVVEWFGTALDIDDIVSAKNLLSETTDLLRLAQDSAGAGVWEWRIDEQMVRHSVVSARMHGIEPAVGSNQADDVFMTVSDWRDRVCPEHLPALYALAARAIERGEIYSGEFRTVGSAAAGPRWLQTFGRVVFDPKTGRPVSIVGLHLDVTARRHAEESLRASEARLRISEERLALALDSANEGLWDWNLTSGEIWVSDRWLEMAGRPRAAGTAAQIWRRTVHPADARTALAGLRSHLRGETPLYECEYRIRRTDGRLVWVLVRGKVVSRDERGPTRMVGTQFEITQRKEAEARVEHLALHDFLTGLPNRTLFRDHLNREFLRCAEGGSRFAVLCLDLDRFKEINDSLGHPSGDSLLQVAAARLKALIGGSDIIARLGGDEFVIVAGVADKDDLSVLAERLIGTVGQPIALDDRQVHVGASIGIAIGPCDGADADALFKHADIALYQAKAAGRNTYRFYEAGMDAAIAARKQLEQDLRAALREHRLSLHYQPILDLRTDSVLGFEALLRWEHPRLGMIPPSQFIPMAEENGLIGPIGAWALQQACSEAAQWPDAMRVSVNVSPVQFAQPGLEDSVAIALSTSGLAAARLELEVTESVLLQDSAAVLACLHRLRAIGVTIALDDFGTGFSSLSYLRRFPFDKIKIDRSFVSEIDDPHTAAIVATTIALGHQLNARTTAEGVEDEVQLAVIRASGCDEAQGFLFSRPLAADELGAFLAKAPLRSAA